MMLEGTVGLVDGRVLGYAEYGNSKGAPVFLFHGQPGNRLFHPPIDQVEQTGVRLVVPDRPGYGLSSFQEGRRLLDWPGDVLAIADHLWIEKFSVIGFSGGGPYAFACAHAIPERLDRVLVVAGAPPMDAAEVRRQLLSLARVNYMVARYAKPIFRLMFRIYWRLARKSPYSFVEMMRKQAPAVDQKVLDDPLVLEALHATWEENLRVDSRGYVYDAEVLMEPWGFGLEGIQKQVELWWGGQDGNVPPQIMNYFSQRLQNCEKRLIPDAGHFGLLTHWEQIFQAAGG